MPHLGPSLDQPIQLSKLLEAGLERSPDEAALLSTKGEASWSELEAVSNGQYHPVAPNDGPAGRAQNRRTDLLVRPR